MGSVLERLASEVGVHERTLRRAAGGGLIRARRPSAHRLVISNEEAAWIRWHWRLVSRLLAVLRTEPNVELAVLFGSVARGEDVEGVSDVDLLVELRDPHPGALEMLRTRLSDRTELDVQLVSLTAARRDPYLLGEVLRDGRPLVDRGQRWPTLRAGAQRTRAQADQVGRELQESARAAVSYFQRLAAARVQSPIDSGR